MAARSWERENEGEEGRAESLIGGLVAAKTEYFTGAFFPFSSWQLYPEALNREKNCDSCESGSSATCQRTCMNIYLIIDLFSPKVLFFVLVFQILARWVCLLPFALEIKPWHFLYARFMLAVLLGFHCQPGCDSAVTSPAMFLWQLQLNHHQA